MKELIVEAVYIDLLHVLREYVGNRFCITYFITGVTYLFIVFNMH